MTRRDDEFGKPSGLEEGGLSRDSVRCGGCSRTVGYSITHPYCPMCGAKLEFSTPSYSGQTEGIATGPERFPIDRRATIVERRRCNRVPCRDVKAGINAEGASTVIGEMPNVSRNGLCVRTFTQFRPEAPVSVATYYTEGTQNIFRDGRVVWTRFFASGLTEYGIEFANARYS